MWTLARARPWDTVAVSAITLILLLHVRFSVRDHRPLTDLGHYYSSFKTIYEGWHAGEGFDLSVLDTPYTLVLVFASMVFGPSVGLMETIDGLWLAVLLAGTWAVARSLAGPLAGAAAVLVLAGAPQTVVLARTHWIHHPETAALAGALGVWALSPGVRTWGHAVGIAVLLFFGETIRQTGLPFGLPVAALVLGAAWRAGARARLVPIAAAAIGGVVWYAPSIWTYLRHKSESAEGYAASVHNPWWHFVEALTPLLLLAALPLAALAFGALRRRDLTAAVVALCVVWLVGTAAAVSIFHVGADNFPIAVVAFALLAGIGVARLPTVWPGRPRAPRVAVSVIGVIALFLQGGSLVEERWLRPFQLFVRPWGSSGSMNYLRVYWNPLTLEQVLPYVRQACAPVAATPGARCELLTSQGLFNPSWEDAGAFALFLGGIEHVEVLTPQNVWDPQGNVVEWHRMFRALIDVQCGNAMGPDQANRFDTQNARMRQMLAYWGGNGPDAAVIAPRSCGQMWYLMPEGVRAQ
ncbi:MAG: hypothetical protein ACK4YP_00230 [Myxococcota bacterium]